MVSYTPVALYSLTSSTPWLLHLTLLIVQNAVEVPRRVEGGFVTWEELLILLGYLPAHE